MAGKHGTVLAFVHSDMGLVEYSGRIQNGVIEAANERGYTLIVLHLEDFSNAELYRKLMGWRVAGVIFHVADLKQISGIAKSLDREKIPYGTVNLSNPGGIGVTTDDASGVEEAVRLLHENKHRNPAYVAFATKNRKTISEYKFRRLDGFLRGMKKYYPECENPVQLYIDPKKGFDQTYMAGIFKQLFEKGVDGVICESDVPAIALNNIASAEGYSVPQVFSLIGFGGSMLAETSFPKITTVVQNFEEMGKITANAVIDKIDKKNGSGISNQLIPVKITIRDSLKKRK
jgi:DNA-binding LacI/PurR family transcriptional regulator